MGLHRAEAQSCPALQYETWELEKLDFLLKKRRTEYQYLQNSSQT